MVIRRIQSLENDLLFAFTGHIYSEDIEALADTAVEAHVFAFLSEIVIKSPLFQQEVNKHMKLILKSALSIFVSGIFNSSFS